MSSTLGVHYLAHNVRKATVAQLTEEARCGTRIIHTFLNILQPCTADKQPHYSRILDRSVVADLHPGSAYIAIFGNAQTHAQATGPITTGVL